MCARRFVDQHNSQLGKAVTMQELVATLDKVKSSVGGADMEKFAQWMDEFGAT